MKLMEFRSDGVPQQGKLLYKLMIDILKDKHWKFKNKMNEHKLLL